MLRKAITVLSLFDGISCGRVALRKAGIPVNVYYASENEKNAIQVSSLNHPNIIHLGDITKWEEWGIDWSSIDLILAGSPCQGFSMIGKQLAFDDPRSTLFFTFLEILDHVRYEVNPEVKFLLENVRMRKDILHAINSLVEVDAHFIDSMLISAQRRGRLYWYNWHNVEIEDKGIELKDILSKDDEDDYTSKLY